MFAFDKAHGYHVAKRMMKALLVGACLMGGLSDAQYLHGLMINEDGTLENILPNCLYSFKARGAVTSRRASRPSTSGAPATRRTPSSSPSPRSTESAAPEQEATSESHRASHPSTRSEKIR